jgi:hypothetical protein
MSTNEMTMVKESGSGKLYESNGFLVPVLTGTAEEMVTNIAIAMLVMLVTTVMHLAGISLVVKLAKSHFQSWRFRHPFFRAQKLGEVILLMFLLSFVEMAVWAGVYLMVGAIENG